MAGPFRRAGMGLLPVEKQASPMRNLFRQFFFYQPPQDPNFASPFASYARSGIKLLVILSLLLIGLGVLILIYPLILAIFVAALFFLIALTCLNFAWRLFRANRQRHSTDQHIHVQIHSPPYDDHQ